MSDPHVSSELDRLADARAAYARLRPRVIAGDPWALAEDFGTGPEASWGPREVLAHVEEMLPYWLGELERIVDGAPGPVPFGRVSENPVRIGILERDRTLPLRVLFDRIDAGLVAWSTRLEGLTAEERAMVGLHPRLGEMRVDRLPEQFVVGHAEGHIQQLEETLAAPRG
jgi:hypothetical protein